MIQAGERPSNVYTKNIAFAGAEMNIMSLRTVGTFVSTIAACAFLGAFGGCNAGWVLAARGISDRVIPILLLGLCVGIAAGSAVYVRSKSSTDISVATRRQYRMRFGLSAGWLLIATFAFFADSSKAHDWTPIDIRFPFDRENEVSAAFTADITEIYTVNIELKRKLPFEDLNAFMGDWQNPDRPPRPSPPRPEIEWTVDKVKEEDRVEYWNGQSWGSDEVELGIGDFKAIKGQRYIITARVLKPSPSMQICDPRLKVAISHIIRPRYYVPAMIAVTGGLIAGIIGLGIGAAAIDQMRRERRTGRNAGANDG